jgi:transcription initiation factor IIE alpha subunit
MKHISIVKGVLKSDLTPNQKIMTGILTSYGEKSKDITPSIEDLMNNLQLSKSQIYAILTNLKKHKIVKSTKRRNKITYTFMYVPYLYEDYFLNPKDKNKYKEGDLINIHKKFTCIKIPKSIISSDLNPEEKLCLGVLYNYSTDKKTAIMDGGQKEIAEILNVTPHSINCTLKKIKQKKLIKTMKEGVVLTYIFLPKLQNFLNMATKAAKIKTTTKQIDRHCTLDYTILKKIYTSLNNQNILTLYLFYYLKSKEGKQDQISTANILKEIPSFTETILIQTKKQLKDLGLFKKTDEGWILTIISKEFENSVFVPIQ